MPSSTLIQLWSRLILISPFFFWGTTMVAMKGTLSHTTPLFLAVVRLLPAGVLVLLGAKLLGRTQAISPKAWAWISLFALVDGTLFQGFLAEGLDRTSAGLGSVIIDSQPLIVAVLALWLFGEQLGLWGWLGLVLGLVGISLLGIPREVWSQSFDPDWLNLLLRLDRETWRDVITAIVGNGQIWMLGAAFCMAWGTIISRWVSQVVDPIVATGWHMILGAFPLTIALMGQSPQPWLSLTGIDYGALIYSSVFGSALSYGLFFYFAAQGNLTSLSALTFLTPIFAMLFGSTILGERLSSGQGVGVLITLGSIYLVNQRAQLDQWVKFPWQSDLQDSSPNSES